MAGWVQSLQPTRGKGHPAPPPARKGCGPSAASRQRALLARLLPAAGTVTEGKLAQPRNFEPGKTWEPLAMGSLGKFLSRDRNSADGREGAATGGARGGLGARPPTWGPGAHEHERLHRGVTQPRGGPETPRDARPLRRRSARGRPRPQSVPVPVPSPWPRWAQAAAQIRSAFGPAGRSLGRRPGRRGAGVYRTGPGEEAPFPGPT